ncbi:MAG TPA: hypothetical protein VHL57_06350 [Flavobacteriales bacterium]|jgi:hypothetical protein|nr:hypothetical protein [Flavobacteriales bacterium]
METIAWSGPPEDRILHMHLDGELDQYRLLAYLQRVDGRYREQKLYPHLDELRIRLEQLMALRRKREELLGERPGDLVGLDLRQGALVRSARAEDELLRTIDAMLDFAQPELKQALARGEELREELAGRIHCGPVGVVPLSAREGYLFLCQGREAAVYTYALPLLREADEQYQYRSLRTRYVTTYTVGLAQTIEHIKADLVRTQRHLPIPATFAFVSDVTLPRVETFMPLAKQLVYELITEHR